MATYDEPYDPIPARRRGAAPADVPRGGMPVPGSDPLAGVQERDILREAFADPGSPTRSMRYGPGDERDLSVPVPAPPPGWRPPMPSELPPARPDPTAPSPLFSGVAGEDFEATRRRGEQVAKLMRETDGPFANPNDWNYVRSYGPRAAAQAVASGRASISGAPPELVAQERERFLRNRTTDLSISPQLRSAARDELAQIERDAAEERRREMWAEEQAARLEGARIAASAPVVGPGGVAAIPNADGGWDVSRPEPAPAAPPAPVSFGGGAGAIPEIGEDGRPTGRYVYQSPPTPSADTDRPIPLGGGGMGVKDPATGEWTIKIPPKQGEKGARAVTLKPGESYYDPETKETYVAPGADRQSIEAEIANLTAALGKAFGQNAIAAIERQLADARARLAALGAPAPAAAAPAEAQPAPASAPAATAPAQPAAAPAAVPASAPAPEPSPSTAPATPAQPRFSKYYEGSAIVPGSTGVPSIRLTDGRVLPTMNNGEYISDKFGNRIFEEGDPLGDEWMAAMKYLNEHPEDEAAKKRYGDVLDTIYRSFGWNPGDPLVDFNEYPTAPAPAAKPAPAPKGYKRLPNGELEYVG